AHLFVNLHPLRYWSLLECASAMLGNSSSGIMESPSLALPCVNVGMRQQGRERAANIIDVEADADAIIQALERARTENFKQSLAGMVNPYGDGGAAKRIVETIAATELGDRLLIKKAVAL
ncbi:MAG: UDP-N-acetylglucosamine 2-epimerase, partial [Acidobacteriota bacterium]